MPDARAFDLCGGLLAGFVLAMAVSLVVAVDAGLSLAVAGLLGAAALVAAALDWQRHAGGHRPQAVVGFGVPRAGAAPPGHRAAADREGRWALRLGDGREVPADLDTVYFAHPACVCARFVEIGDHPLMRAPAGHPPRRLLRARSRVAFVFSDALCSADHRALRGAVRGVYW